MKWKDLFYINKSDRRIVLALLTVVVIALLAFHFVGADPSGVPAVQRRTPYYNNKGEKQQRPPQYYQQPAQAVERFPFDPNTADSTQLLRLGLQPWQVRNIYKYRAAGGIYRQKEDFARLYGLTVKQYRELEPYIRISADYQPASSLVSEDTYTRDTTSLRYPVKIAEGEHIDLNALDTTLYRTVPGIGSYYARKIHDYGERLGGYVSSDQLDEIDDFPQESKAYFEVPSTDGIRKIRINQLSLNELKRHPYINYYQAKAIVEYRRQNGPITNLNDLHLLRDFPQEAITRLLPYISYD